MCIYLYIILQIYILKNVLNNYLFHLLPPFIKFPISLHLPNAMK